MSLKMLGRPKTLGSNIPLEGLGDKKTEVRVSDNKFEERMGDKKNKTHK